MDADSTVFACVPRRGRRTAIVLRTSQQFCQVWMDVEAQMPDCGIGGHHDFRREGDTFHFAFFAEYSEGACYGRGTYQDGLSICIPGEGQPRIAPGAYTIVVNGVTGSFTIP